MAKSYKLSTEAVRKTSEVVDRMRGIPISTRKGSPTGPQFFQSFPAKITAVAGSFPRWIYTVQRIVGYNGGWVTDGVNVGNVLNGCETSSSGVASWTYGNGISVSSTGAITGGTCLIKSMPIGSPVEVFPTINTITNQPQFLFIAESSGQ